MSHPLDGCRAKIERANENIKNLGTEIITFTSGGGYTVVRDVNNEAREYTFRAFGPDTTIPLRFAVLAGEIIHHLRSSLDHLIWALVLTRHKTPDFKVQFPICITEEEFIAARRKGIIKGVSASAQALVERSQPYFKLTPQVPDPPNHPLAILHDLNITDKHKLLVVASVYIAGASAISFSAPSKMADAQFIQYDPPIWGAGFAVRPTKDGTKVLRVRLLPGMPLGVDVKADFPIEIAFEKFGTENVKPIIPGLTRLRDAVVKTIELFSGEF
jgi:hypothetical protein